ncbi:MAG TPA: type IV secretory system conjugative DNA transfer family protein [Candidatus Obscuribacter sp.]|nr:MAG: Conjugal transfer protein TraG [bacterium ADurb.Bin425]HMW90732.1 type IV secretory system conjugative DNA transfer family protein [Candidatus Obscuribacter sp.]HND05999.1 type IV secretory system conjugative DNA transfer family protein [Candidatus Obscuribacter sp.]HND68619.1 type IV secretory system conjugative DNA transfer family protein [Candidatus Obscuribacter sp.]HNG77336.1 type IV secretory system conjugative DNA transfer family protein [Candidatus Obscuribacter sp.]
MRVEDTGIVDTPLKDFPILAVNVLDRLGYQVSRASKQLDQILAVEKVDEQVGRDWWRHEYRLVLRWRKAESGVFVSVELEEKKGTASQSDCQKRCDRIFLELQKDADRAHEARSYREPSTVHGAARWGTDEELKAAKYIQKAADPKRLIIGRTQDKQYLQVPEFWTHAHSIVCGRTGVGKSRGFFIPQLVERIGTSMIVTEATPGYEAGELYKLTSGWRKMAGHQIYCFNPSDLTSNRINPIDRIRRAPEELKAQLAEKLADLVIMNGESTEAKGEQTWNRSEKLLLIPLILHAAAGEPQFGHFGALRWLILQGPDRLAQILRRSPSDVAQMEFEGWLRLSGETDFKYGVFSGLITKLNPWMTDQMVTLTETTDIDMDALKKQLFTFYLAVPSRSRDSKLIGSLMVNFLLDHVLEIREEMKYPLTMLLDEFTNFGKISGIGDTLSIIRKNKIGLILGFQNYAQLEQVYSRREAQIIIDMPATQVYFKQKTFKEAKDLSEAIGRTTIEEATVSDSGRVQEFVQGRALITPDELISLKDEVIVFTADTKPLRLPLTSPTAYEQAMEYDAPVREKHEVSEFVRKRGRVARSQQSEQRQSVKPSSNKPKEPQNKGGKKEAGRFERSKTSEEDKKYNEKEPEERKPEKRDRYSGAPDFR